jgi:hypothetical protein
MHTGDLKLLRGFFLGLPGKKHEGISLLIGQNNHLRLSPERILLSLKSVRSTVTITVVVPMLVV